MAPAAAPEAAPMPAPLPPPIAAPSAAPMPAPKSVLPTACEFAWSRIGWVAWSAYCRHCMSRLYCAIAPALTVSATRSVPAKRIVKGFIEGFSSSNRLRDARRLLRWCWSASFGVGAQRLAQKIEQHPVYFFRRLMLHPMAGSRQVDGLAVVA